MGHPTSIGKTRCFFCGKTISRNGLGFTSHMRKHVREGIAVEINKNHRNYEGIIEFHDLRRLARIGTIKTTVILDKYSFDPKIGKKIKFRYNNDNSKWLTGTVNDIDDNYIFIGLLWKMK